MPFCLHISITQQGVGTWYSESCKTIC